MRIGIDVAKALGPSDGIGRYVRGLVGGLMAIDRDRPDRRYRLYPLFEPAGRERFDEVFPDPPANFTFETSRAPGPGDVDLFHATAWLLPEGWRGPSAITVYDLTFLTHPEAHTLGNRLHCLAGTARAAARGSRFVAISESTRRDLERELAIGPAGVAVAYPAADPVFRPAAGDPGSAERRREGEELARRHAISPRYLLSVGTLEPRKNLERLIEAFRRLPPALADGLELVLAGGGGWLGVDPERWAREHGLEGRVRYLGAVPDAELARLYSHAACFAYPSLYEGFGLPPLEAMACGAPVVVSDVSSLPEVVGEAGVRVDPLDPAAIGDGLARVLGDPELAARLRRQGPERAARFSWAETARATAGAYERALAGAEGPG